MKKKNIYSRRLRFKWFLIKGHAEAGSRPHSAVAAVAAAAAAAAAAVHHLHERPEEKIKELQFG